MHPVLAELVRRFREAQDRGVAVLTEQLAVPLPKSNRDWFHFCNSQGLYQARTIKGVGFYAHGYGVELTLEDMTIDFDWGDAGEADGFDAWRLWKFIDDNKLDIQCNDDSQVDEWLQQAYRAGELTKDDHLYYSPAHRARANQNSS
jgi:hypothetical protein